jgi:hypothetical protein
MMILTMKKISKPNVGANEQQPTGDLTRPSGVNKWPGNRIDFVSLAGIGFYNILGDNAVKQKGTPFKTGQAYVQAVKESMRGAYG